MRFNVNIKPMRVEAETKHDVTRKAIGSGRNWSTGTNGVGYTKIGTSDTIRVYNLEKHRKVVHRTVVKGKKTSKIVKRGHWVAFVYDFPIAALEVVGLRVVQGERTFTLKSRRR